MSEDTGMVRVATAESLFEARLIVGRLQAEGIPADIAGESVLETLDGMATMWAGGVPIEVPREMVDRAVEILAEPPASDEDGGGEEIVLDADEDQGDD